MEEQKKPAQRHYAPRPECKIKRFQLHVYFQHQAHARYVFGERFKRPRLPQNRISPAEYRMLFKFSQELNWLRWSREHHNRKDGNLLLLVGLLGGLGAVASDLLGGGGLGTEGIRKLSEESFQKASKDKTGRLTLMTPTATVCLMSLTANLPRGG